MISNDGRWLFLSAAWNVMTSTDYEMWMSRGRSYPDIQIRHERSMTFACSDNSRRNMFFTAWCVGIVRAMLSQDVCLSVRLSHAGIVSKRLNISSNFFHHLIDTPFEFLHIKRYGNIPTGTSPTGASNAEVVWKKRDFRLISRFILEMIQERAIITMERQ